MIGVGAVAFIVTFVLTPILRQRSLRAGLLDIPNERSSHSVPTPRSGGKAMVAGLACALFVAALSMPFAPFVAVVLSVPIVTLSGLIDDRRGMREWQKFLFQAMAAMAYLMLSRMFIDSVELGALSLRLGVLAAPFTFMWLVGFTNVFNFMDGVNGLASSQAVIAAAVFVAIALRHGDIPTAVLALAILGAAAGFLPWNFPSGSVFMGDTGSTTLGMLLAICVVRLARDGFLVAALPLLPFVFDGTLTFFLRFIRRERWFKAHRSHIYQRLTDLGWSHTKVTAAVAGTSVICSAVALLHDRLSPSLFLGCLAAVTLGLAAAAAVVLQRSAFR